MLNLFHSIAWRLRAAVNPQMAVIAGVRLNCDKAKMPAGIRRHLFKGIYEEIERDLVLRILKPGMRTLEIGTGIGFISILATKLCGAGYVRSFEANVKLEPIIRENYELNGLVPDLTMKAVTVDGIPVTFFRDENILSSSLIDRQRNDVKMEVPSVAFSDIVEKFDPEVLLMDVEGAEVDLLVESLGNIQHIIVELHPHVVGVEKIEGLKNNLRRRGFQVVENDRKTFYFRRNIN